MPSTPKLSKSQLRLEVEKPFREFFDKAPIPGEKLTTTAIVLVVGRLLGDLDTRLEGWGPQQLQERLDSLLN